MLRYFCVIMILCSPAMADFIYHEELAIGGGVGDASGGIDFEANGDMETSGTIIGQNSGRLVLDATNATDSLIMGGSEQSLDSVLYPTTAGDFWLGTVANPFNGNFDFIAVGTIISDFFRGEVIDLVPISGGDSRIEFNTVLQINPFLLFGPNTMTGVDFTGTGDVAYYINVGDSTDPAPAPPPIQTPEFLVEGDGITANVIINAEGGIAIGGTTIISVSNGEKLLFEDGTSVMEAGSSIDFALAPLVDSDISDSITIGSSGDLSAPPIIGGTTPNAGSFTAILGTSIALSSISQILHDSSSSQAVSQYFSYADNTLVELNRASGVVSTPTIIASGDTIASITAKGYDGTNYETAARIDFEIFATPGNDDMPGIIRIYVTPDGSETAVEEFSIESQMTRILTELTLGADETDGTILRIEGQRATASPTVLQFRNFGESGGNRAGVTDDLVVTRIQFLGSFDGTQVDPGAQIRVVVDGTPGSNDMPMRIQFLTSPDGTDTLTLALTIDSAQDVIFENQLLAGSTVIVNSSEEIPGAALEDANGLSGDTWTAFSETNVQGLTVDTIDASGTGISYTGTGQTVAMTSFFHTITSGGAPGSVQTITGASFTGQELLLLNSGANATTFIDTTGNIRTSSGGDVAISSGGWMKFFYDGTNWRELSNKA